MSTFNQKIKDAEVMAKALALLVLYHPEKVDNLLKQYNIDSTDFDAKMRLLYVERLIQTNKGFANTITNLIFQTFSSVRNFIGDAIAGALSGVMNGVAGIINATSDSGKKVRETQAQAQLTAAQAELAKAQAQIEKAKAMQIASARKRQNLIGIVGVSVAGIVLSIGIFAYFKFKK